MSDRDYGINILRLWWNATPMAPLGFMQFPQAVSYYDRINPDFLASFGKSVRSISLDKLKPAMERLAADRGNQFPRYSEFLDYVAQETGSLSLSDAREIAADSASDLAKIASAGAGLYLLIAIAGAYLFMRGSRAK